MVGHSLGRLAEKKYLKTIYECLEKCTSLFGAEPPGGKQPDVLNLDQALRDVGRLKAI
jgi:hypothetical protein